MNEAPFNIQEGKGKDLCERQTAIDQADNEKQARAFHRKQRLKQLCTLFVIEMSQGGHNAQRGGGGPRGFERSAEHFQRFAHRAFVLADAAVQLLQCAVAAFGNGRACTALLDFCGCLLLPFFIGVLELDAANDRQNILV